MPSNRIDPLDGFTSPEIARSVVLLPAPFAPSRPTASPSPISIETPVIAGTEPYAALTPESLSMRASAGRSVHIAGAEIGADHFRIFNDFLRCAFGDLLAVIEHHDMARHRHDGAHDVLHDDDREAALREFANQRHGLVDLGRIEPGHYLVEQENLRLRRQRARHLKPPLVDGGEVLCRRLLARREADEVDRLARSFAR